MPNWYKLHIKQARRGTDRPLMDEYAEFGRQQDELDLTRANPLFGGEKRRTPDGKGYPKGISQTEDDENNELDGVQEIQPGRTILDDEIFTGEGTNHEEFVDDIDKMPIKKEPDPVGPHNMQRGLGLDKKYVYDAISRRSRKLPLNKL